MYLKGVYLLIIFVICLLLQASYIRIILEIATLIFFYIPTNIRNLSIRFQEPKFFNSITPEVQNSESIRFFVFFFAKDLKNSFFLYQIYSLLSYILLLSFSFVLFFIFKIIHFIFHAVPIIRMMYPLLSGSPPGKPRASIGFLVITSLNICSLSSLSYYKFLVYRVVIFFFSFIWLMANKKMI